MVQSKIRIKEELETQEQKEATKHLKIKLTKQ